jgi:hypothetical protein
MTVNVTNFHVSGGRYASQRRGGELIDRVQSGWCAARGRGGGGSADSRPQGSQAGCGGGRRTFRDRFGQRRHAVSRMKPVKLVKVLLRQRAFAAARLQAAVGGPRAPPAMRLLLPLLRVRTIEVAWLAAPPK